MKRSTMILLLFCFVTTQILAVTAIKPDFDFFFFVQHWPGAADGDTAQSTSSSSSSSSKGKPGTSKGKPGSTSKGKQTPKTKITEKSEEIFGIHGLWPEYNDGSYPTKCDPENKHPFKTSLFEDLIPELQKHWHSLASPNKDGEETWKHEWVKHGTCSLSSLDQRGYFESALNLKKKANILELLVDAGVKPDGSSYKLDRILTPLIEGLHGIDDDQCITPGIECNSKGELYQVYICVDKSGNGFINCPVYPRIKNCDTKNIIFPSFGDHRHANDEL